MTSPTRPPARPRRRRQGLSDQAAATAIDQACRALRLPTVRTSVEDMVTAAEHEQLSYRGFLAELLLGECEDRDRRRSARRVKAGPVPFLELFQGRDERPEQLSFHRQTRLMSAQQPVHVFCVSWHWQL